MSNPIIVEQFIEASPEKVWQALTNKQLMKEWYFDIADFELKEGAVFNFYESEKKEYHHRGTVLEVIPNRKLKHTWTHPGHSKGSSVLTWELIPESEGTKVRLTHEGLENFADAGPAFARENYVMGWDAIVHSNLKNYLYGVRKKIYHITIQAPAEKVWNALFDPENYKKWTGAFGEGSYYSGEMKQGGRIHFLMPDGSGMYADVPFFQPHSLAVFKIIGQVKNFEEQPLEGRTAQLTGGFEQYHLSEENGETHLKAEVDTAPEFVWFFDEAFPKALENLKEIAES
jgi:uncharacterized protein YndB with AHSA1/START domain